MPQLLDVRQSMKLELLAVNAESITKLTMLTDGVQLISLLTLIAISTP
jgi:hypothetical protein